MSFLYQFYNKINNNEEPICKNIVQRLLLLVVWYVPKTLAGTCFINISGFSDFLSWKHASNSIIPSSMEIKISLMHVYMGYVGHFRVRDTFKYISTWKKCQRVKKSMANILTFQFEGIYLIFSTFFAASKFFQLWSVSVFYWFEKKYKVRMNDLFCKNWWYASALSLFCVIVGYFPVKLYLSSYCRDYILLGNFIVIVLSPFLVICTLNRKLYLFIKQNSSTAGNYFG